MKIANNVPLRPYQQRQVEEVDSAIARNIRRMIIQASCGAGKTVVSGYLANKLSMPRTIMQVHRDELVRQTEEKVLAMNPGISIGVVKAERNELDRQFTIVSAQTLANEKRLNKLIDAIGNDKVLFLDDECFVAGTLISTSKGRIPIEHVKVGDMVISWNESGFYTKRVSRLFKNKAPDELYVIYVDKYRIACTENHPILTKKGWCAASNLSTDDMVLVYNNISCFFNVNSIRKIKNIHPDNYVYNLEVEDNHSYVANGIVVHNCHHSPSTTRRRTIETIAPEILIGLTATAYRTDKKKLSDIYEEIVSVTTAYELINDGWLVDATGLRVDIDVNLDGINTVGGDFNSGQLAATMDTHYLNRLVVDNWEQYADSAGRKKTIAFCVNKLHAEHLYQEFTLRGHKAALVLDSTKTPERQSIYKEFEEGNLKVIINVMVISEGIDLPCIDCILMCRPTKSLVLFVQCIGRGMRLYHGKENLLVLDFVGNSNKHSLITLPTWAGVEALGEDSLDYDHLRVTESVRKSGKSTSMFNLVNQIRGAKTKKVTQFDVLSGGGFKWNMVDGHWMVNTGKEYVTIVKSTDGFTPYNIKQETTTNSRGRLQRTWKAEAIFSRPLAMDMAIGVAETKMKMNPLTDRSASWRLRADEPSEAQLKYAAILGLNIPNGITKSELADAIDKAAFAAAMKTLTFD